MILIPEFRGWPRFRRACSHLLVSCSRRPVSPSESFFLGAQADDCPSVPPSQQHALPLHFSCGFSPPLPFSLSKCLCLGPSGFLELCLHRTCSRAKPPGLSLSGFVPRTPMCLCGSVSHPEASVYLWVLPSDLRTSPSNHRSTDLIDDPSL